MRLDLHRSALSIDDDGSLRIAAERVPHGCFLIEPWDRGFTARRHLGGLRYAVALWDTALLSSASPAADADVLTGFIAGIPSDVATAIARYRFGQCPMLRAVATSTDARDLLASNPNLLWLLLFAVYERRVPATSIAECCRMKQRDILARSLGVGSASLVRLSQRIEISAGHWRDARLLQSAFFNETLVDAVRHLDAIPLELVELLQRHRYLRSRNMARLLCNEMAKNGVRGRAGDNLARRVSEIVDFARVAGFRNGEQIIARCNSVGDICRLHRRWFRRMSEALINPEFPPPPFPDSDDIQAVRTAAELRHEGRLQSNCVARYTSAVAKGRSYFYRVLRPNRATLELRNTEDGWRIGQLKLGRNRIPEDETHVQVVEWLVSARLPRPHRGEPRSRNCRT